MMRPLLEPWIDQRENQVALVDFRWGEITWGTLREIVDRACGVLTRWNLSIPIAHRCNNGIEEIVTAIAIAELGGIEAPIDRRTESAEFDRRVKLLGGQFLTNETKQSFLSSERVTSPDSQSPDPDVVPGIILWTSGTTRSPQGVHLSHQAWLSNAAAKLAAVPQSSDDIRLTVLPLSHAYARTCDLGTWLLSGSTLAITIGLNGLLNTAPIIRPTLINCVPSIAYRLLETLDEGGSGKSDSAKSRSAIGIERLRLLGVGGAPLSEGAFAQWKDRGVTVIQGYGLTETGPVICSATPGNAAPGLVGDFVDGWESRVVDGELHVRGPYTMEGYWQQEQATREKLDLSGWIRTGDQVDWDETSGQRRVLGRTDDVIVMDNGMKVHPSEIERQIEQCSGVQYAMLLKRDQIELWIDGKNVDEAAVNAIMHQQRLRCEVHSFNPPLSQRRGELTSKETIRRKAVMRRFRGTR